MLCFNSFFVNPIPGLVAWNMLGFTIFQDTYPDENHDAIQSRMNKFSQDLFASRQIPWNTEITESGLTITDIYTGDGAEATPGKKVTVNYKGMLNGMQQSQSNQNNVQSNQNSVQSNQNNMQWIQLPYAQKVFNLVQQEKI